MARSPRSVALVAVVATVALLAVPPAVVSAHDPASADGAAEHGPQSERSAGRSPDRPANPAVRAPGSGARAFTSRLERGERADTPEDRYALAGGCYTMTSAATGARVARDSGGFTARSGSGHTGEPFHMQATDLGSYLLLASEEDVLAASEGAVGEAIDSVPDSSAVAMADGVSRGAVESAAQDLRSGPAGTGSGRGGSVVAAAAPSELADWEVHEDHDLFRLVLPAVEAALIVDADGRLDLAPLGEVGDEGLFSFRLADGCATWPEIPVNVEGPVLGGRTPWAEVSGYLDAHLHGMAFEFLGGRARCGQPWHRYGVAHALQGCPEHEDSGGRTNLLETAVSGSVNPVEGHDTQGWPTFEDWPAHDLLTYEQVYYRWLERSWRGGLRLVVNLLVDNYVLCEVYPFKVNSCNEMDGVRLQAERIREFERYVDAQHGGPGQGWFRVVTDPFEARRVMNEGRLAVVLGMEVSRPFDCRLLHGIPQCDEAQIDEQIDEVYELGVRQMELVNKFDNALTGVKGDAGDTGLIVNAGNVVETGGFWRMETCDDEGHGHDHGDGHAHDNNQHNVHDATGSPDELSGRDALAGQILQETGRSGIAPLYAGGPHCNVMGLTELGEHTLARIMELGMIFDPDHMSARARHEAMDLIEAAGYSGVISSHSWADDIVYQRILRAGGVVTPMAGASTRFVERWREHREWADDRYLFGFGFGSDINGFARQGAPRRPADDDRLTYPFTGFGGVVVDRQVSGERVYDINDDGVAHYGLYVDWVEDVRLVAGEDGDAIIADMLRGPEAYLQMWERAIGVHTTPGRAADRNAMSQRLGGVSAGASADDAVRALGQPTERSDDALRWSLDDGGHAEVLLDADGRVVASAIHDASESPLPATGGGAALAALLLAAGASTAIRRRVGR